MKTVRDIMSPVVIHLEASSFLPEAARELQKHGISGAPVVNREGEYIGFLSQTDVNAKMASAVTPETSYQALLEGDLPKDLESVQIKDVMSPQILKISADATLEELGQTLLLADVHRLLVSEGDDIVGLVSTTDLIHGFLHPAKESPKTAPKGTRKPYHFETELEAEEKNVTLTTASGHELHLGAPQEFGGSGELASPEELFIASISSCLCLTFGEFARRSNLKVRSYRCRAVGRLEGDGTSLRFTRVDLYPKIEVHGSAEKTEQILTQAKLRCLVGRSADLIVVIHPEIRSFEQE